MAGRPCVHGQSTCTAFHLHLWTPVQPGEVIFTRNTGNPSMEMEGGGRGRAGGFQEEQLKDGQLEEPGVEGSKRDLPDEA